MADTVKIEVVVGENELAAWRDAVKVASGTLDREETFTPKAEEIDRFADPQMEPLVLIAVGIGLTALSQQILNLIDRLRGEEVLVIDTTAKPRPQIRRVPLGRATEIVVIHEGGTEHFPRARKGEALAFARAVLK